MNLQVSKWMIARTSIRHLYPSSIELGITEVAGVFTLQSANEKRFIVSSRSDER
ncbi:MAG: hypothetical protein ACO1RT_00590 [Planctomycetaceae bacterium]